MSHCLHEREKYHIGPDWPGIVITGICVVISGYCTAIGVTVVYPKIDMWFLLLVSLLALCTQCKSYTLCSDGITVLLFGIRIRNVSFDHTSSIILLSKKGCKNYVNGYNILIFTTCPCEHDIASSKSILLYIILHPSHTLPVRVPQKISRDCFELIEDLSSKKILQI